MNSAHKRDPITLLLQIAMPQADGQTSWETFAMTGTWLPPETIAFPVFIDGLIDTTHIGAWNYMIAQCVSRPPGQRDSHCRILAPDGYWSREIHICSARIVAHISDEYSKVHVAIDKP